MKAIQRSSIPPARNLASRPLHGPLYLLPRRRTAYNQPVVHTFLSTRFLRPGRLFWTALALILSMAVPASAQTPGNLGPTGGAGSRILLVLPFDNRTGQPSLEWIREAAAEILSSRLASAGFAPMSRADRIYALDHLGLPQGFHPSRATSLKLAETLDADSIIVGSYMTDGTGIVAEAQLVDVPHLRMSEPVTARGEMREMIAVFDSLAWKLTRQLDPGFKALRRDLCGRRLRPAAGRLRAVHSRHHRAGPAGASAPPESIGHCSARPFRRRGWRWGARSTPASSTSRRPSPSPR